MAQAPNSDSEQPSVLMYFNSVQSSGKELSLKDNLGDIVAAFIPTKDYSSVVISSPKLTLGNNYTLYMDNYKVVDFTLSSTLTYLTESGVIESPQNIGQGGNRPPRNGQRPPREGFNENKRPRIQ